MSAVVLKALTKIYPGGKEGEVFAVRQVDLEVREGELMALVGPSGCGKSSLLRMIAGLDAVSNGTIEIDGKTVNQVAPKDRDVAMVFQNYALFPYMTVYENMAFGLKFGKVSRDEIRKRVSEAAEILDLTEYLARYPKELSGGQRQRVAVGRAIVCEPKVFLFDEPLSNLDAKMRTQMRAEIAKLHRRLHATIIFVTHDQTEAMTLGDRICVMNLGQVMQVGTPSAVYRNPGNTFVAEFIGNPGMNIVRGRLVQNGDRLRFSEVAPNGGGMEFDLETATVERIKRFAGKEVFLGIRPESIELPSELSESRWIDGIPVVAEYCEALGHEMLVYLRTGNHSIIARSFGNEFNFRKGEIEIRLNHADATFFDPSTNEAL